MSPEEKLVRASRRFARACSELPFRAPVSFVYNPLLYARASHDAYLRKFAGAKKRVIFLGMNPGPWGMAQTGVPFGEVEIVRDWLRITEPGGAPAAEHPRVPVRGFACTRSEVSGRRLWGLIRSRFGTPEAFFRQQLVANYCPLLFLDAQGRNLTPDRIAPMDRAGLESVCDDQLAVIVKTLEPQWLVGIGRFAEKRLRMVAARLGWDDIRIAMIPHPSPANPGANRDWSGQTESILTRLGIW